MPLDYRIYDRVNQFNPVQRYQSGVRTGQNNLLFKQLMEDRAEKKQRDAENKNILSVYERVSGVMPFIQTQNYEGADEWLDSERERILADNPSADMRDTDVVKDLLRRHKDGDTQALGQLSALHREMGNRASNRGLIELPSPPTAGSYVEGFVDDQFGYFPKNTRGLKSATEEEKDAVALGLKPKTDEWDTYIKDRLDGSELSGSFSMGVDTTGNLRRMRDDDPQMDRKLRPNELDALAAGLQYGTPEWGDFISKEEESDIHASAGTKQWLNGTRQLTLSDGSQRVYTGDGVLQEGGNALAAIAAANEHETALQGQRAGRRVLMTDSARLSTESFEALAPMKVALNNLRDGIDLMKAGAPSGPMRARMPAITSLAEQLRTLQGRMGLDVIGQTTFGALSAGELALALDIGVNLRLPEDDLLEWFEERADAQQKLITYMEEAAIYFGAGNTAADWIQVQREISGQPATVGRFQIEVLE